MVRLLLADFYGMEIRTREIGLEKDVASVIK